MTLPRPSWPQLVGIGGLLLALGQRTMLLNDPDTYMHIAAGRWMLANGGLPIHDPFSHSMAGAPWLPHEWLAEIVFAVTYDRAGWAGLVLVTVLPFAWAMAWLTRRVLDRFEPMTGLIAVVSSMILLEPHLLVRAHALALPLLVVWSTETIAARDDGRAPPWWLAGVLALWANLHGSYMAGLALAGYLGCEAVLQTPADRWGAARRWGGFIGLSAVAALATPNFLGGFLLPFEVSGMKVLQSTFIEWQPPDFQHFQPLDLWIGAAVLALAGGFQLPIPRVLLVGALLFNAMAHQRHADLLAVMGPLLLAASLGPDLAARIRTERPSPVARMMASWAGPAGAGAISAGLLVVLAVCAGELAVPIVRGDGPVTPASAVAAARGLKLDGPVFNEEAFGGYLIFSGVKVFIDGRMEMYGDDFLSRYLNAESGHQPALADLLDRYHIAWTLLPPDSVAAQELDRDPGWKRVYADKIAVIHRREPPPA